MQKLSKSQVVQIGAIVATLVLAFAPVVLAAATGDGNFDVPNAPGNLPNDTKLSDLILTIINVALTVAGLIAVLFLIIGGFRYITSAGNEETAEQGKKIIINALIGVVVIILSFVIVRVIANTLLTNGGV